MAVNCSLRALGTLIQPVLLQLNTGGSTKVTGCVALGRGVSVLQWLWHAESSRFTEQA